MAGLPFEPIPRVVQDLAAPAANRHDGSQDRSIKSGSRQSGEEPPVDCDRTYLRVVTAEVQGINPDYSLEAHHGLLRTGARRKGDKRLRTEDQAGESETIHGKAIARNIGPFGVYLKRRRRRFHNGRWQTLLRSCGGGRPRSAQDEKRSGDA